MAHVIMLPSQVISIARRPVGYFSGPLFLRPKLATKTRDCKGGGLLREAVEMEPPTPARAQNPGNPARSS